MYNLIRVYRTQVPMRSQQRINYKNGISDFGQPENAIFLCDYLIKTVPQII